ncbi:spermine/spermidine synthase domain-containing protein [Streptacidiphilus fuscans]|uniref:Polyamine aminopropyltransferase n=1 Tax=Streptacidiphilus fuscans TaxID=2789292 RepID=A0A931B0U6_9ACTN|nr:spermidine synthase [Streptacidiphilus fuscans]MBF9068349.1 spermidine synthase [Streptacidiphilus fuscans]
MINPSPRAARLLVLLAAFVCAACGLVYELDLVALGSYLLGDSVTQASVVLSVMVCAMGAGSLLAKRFTRRPASSFALVESALALIGGLSVLALYGCFVWFGHYQVALVAVASLIGLLIGAEIPLLMTLMQRVRRQEAGRAVADLFAADYVGALIGGLAFPFLLLPTLGQLTGALVTGVVNTVAGGLIALWIFRREPAPRARLLLWLLSGAVVAILLLAWAGSGAFERAAQRRLYGGPVRVSEQSRYQQIVVTGQLGSGGSSGQAGAYGPDAQDAQAVPGGAARQSDIAAAGALGGPGRLVDAAALTSVRVYLDSRIAVCGRDQAAYHAALTGPALVGPHARVLVLGGGDGLAARQVLDTPGVRKVTLVEQDPDLLQLARTDPVLSTLNRHVLDDPRVDTVTADAFGWLRTAPRQEHPYDVIVADLPGPQLDDADKLYTSEFYGLVRRMLAPGGRLVVHAGSRLWSVADTVRSVGLSVLAYDADGRGGCGPVATPTWSFVLAAAAPAHGGQPLALPYGPSHDLQGVPSLHVLTEPRGHADRVTTLLDPR